MNTLLWIVLCIGIILWCCFWGGYTVRAANPKLSHRRGKHGEYMEVQLPIFNQIFWFLLGALIGPFGPVIAIRSRGEIISWDYSISAQGGWKAIRIILNPLKWFHLVEKFSKDREGFLKAIRQGDVESVKAYLNKGINPNLTNDLGEAVLLVAATAFSTQIMQILINAGANVDKKDPDGQPSLMYHSIILHPSNLKVLIDAGADVNARNAYGDTALISASGNNRPEVIQLLITAGADINVKDSRGRTALMEAVTCPRIDDKTSEIINMLIQAGADVNARSTSGETALSLAIDKGLKQIIPILLKAGAPPIGLCMSCFRKLKPFQLPRGTYVGNLLDTFNMPQLEQDNALVCENCKATVCLVCSGEKASALNMKEFVCTQCGYKPLRTIYRAT